MDVIVDGGRDFRLQGEPADVLSAVVAAGEFLQAKGRALMSVKADGQDIAPDQLVEALQGKSLDEVKELRITSEDVTKLVDSCLSALGETLPELPEICHQLAAVFQGSTPTEGFEPFQRMADIWAEIKSREIMIVNALGLTFAELSLEGRNVAELHNELNGFLLEAAGALESGDLVLLGDLLEYELAPRAEIESQIVALLQERSQSQAG
ncbi:MAG: hypothetical protein IT365_19720 [Candidatus Hydrogenedentes bacterium]|nr:hypothetical protein [Candidatus Hydrogenedentota bacterium]